uniref:Uncharacterized protein n=1 Tax=Vitis vinifera TaxID=29760 RepID=A5B611_VITVI|nr:hypothetical protein VITISV_027477 [Vitis vinifera]
MLRKRDRLRVQDVGTPLPEDTERVRLSGSTPSGFPKRTCGRPVRTSFAPCIPDLLMAKDFKASILYVSELSIALPWIPKNSPHSRIALVIKKLSKHQNLMQFD